MAVSLFIVIENGRVSMRDADALVAHMREERFICDVTNEIHDRYIASGSIIYPDGIFDYLYENFNGSGDRSLDVSEIENVLQQRGILIIRDHANFSVLEQVEQFLANPASWLYLRTGDQYKISETTIISHDEYERFVASGGRFYNGNPVQGYGISPIPRTDARSVTYLATKTAQRDLSLVCVHDSFTSEYLDEARNVEGFDPSMYRDGVCFSGDIPTVMFFLQHP